MTDSAEPAALGAALEIVRSLDDLDRLAPLGAYRRVVAEGAGALLDDGVDVLAVTRDVSAANAVLAGRLLTLGEAELGPPPYAYAWVALGSHGRGEAVLSSDQDNALVYAGPRLGAADPEEYFTRLATAVVDGLARAGVRPCSGGWMATRWHPHLDDLRRQVARWVGEPRPEHMLGVEMFLDLRRVHGQLDVDGLVADLVTGVRSGAYLRELAAATLTLRPAVVTVGRIRTDHGRLDLKRAGSAAVVLMARLLAVAAGTTDCGTQERLRAAVSGGTLSEDGATRLLDAYRTMTRLRLSHQVAQVGRGEEPDDLVRPAQLSAGDQRALRHAVNDVRMVQRVTAERYGTDLLG